MVRNNINDSEKRVFIDSQSLGTKLHEKNQIPELEF